MAFIDADPRGPMQNGAMPPPEMMPEGMGMDGMPPEGMPPLQPGPGMQMPQQMRMPPKPSPKQQRLLNMCHPQVLNIITEFDINDDVLGKISAHLRRGYDADLRTLDEYYEKSEKAFDLAAQVATQKDYPWPKASNVIYPLITTAAISFASRAYPAIIAGRNVVKGLTYGDDDGTPLMGPDGTPMIQGPAQDPEAPGVVMGPDGTPLQVAWETPPGAKRERADKIGEHMSYQLLEQTPAWEEDTDKLLHMLPIAGCYFRKTWFDPLSGKNLSSLISPKKLVINYKAKSMERAPRHSEEFELYPNEIEGAFRNETFRKVELGIPQQEDGDDDEAPHVFIEQHCWYDLDEDGYKEPYIITAHKESWKVVRIIARFDPEGILFNKRDPEVIVRIEPVPYYTKYDFLPSIDGGLYGTGFGQLLNPINQSINTTLNMLIDAGHLQSTGGGFVGKGISMHSGSVRFRPGEWKVINSPGQDIRNAMIPLQTAGPSDVLLQLLAMLVKAGEQIAASNDVLEGSANMATMQPTTMLALIEQGLKVFTAIYKRIHRSLKYEFKLIYRLNRLYLEEHEEYQYGDEWRTISREDYEQGAGVCPYSDPEMVSDMQQMARAQLLLGMKDDALMDRKEIYSRVFEAAKIERPEELFAPKAQPDPLVVSTVEETQANTELKKSQIAKHAVEEASERAKQAETWSKMLLNLANVEKLDSDKNLDWVYGQMEAVKIRMEGVNGQALGGTPQQGLPPPGAEGGGGAEGEEEPPLPEARKAPDGRWYVDDPERQGKYLQVQSG